MSVLRRLGPALLPPVLAVVVALVICSAVMAALGVNPFAGRLSFGETGPCFARHGAVSVS